MPEPALACRSALVLGGARSGKSRYAQALAEASGAECALVATAEALDSEMAARIARHRAERGARWRVREEPLNLAAALTDEARPGRIVVVDCVTLWLSNLIHAGRDSGREIAALAEAIGRLGGPAIFVSNEVGSGITPENDLARLFCDEQGRANAALAAACDLVVAMTAGLPRLVKPAPVPNPKFT